MIWRCWWWLHDSELRGICNDCARHLRLCKHRFSIKILLTHRKLHGILFLMQNGNYLNANLLKGRDAKPEGAKVRKFDKVSRLQLFPYHDARVKRSKSRSCLHDKAFELGTRQTWESSDLRSKSADFECLQNCGSCFAAEQFVGISWGQNTFWPQHHSMGQ